LERAPEQREKEVEEEEEEKSDEKLLARPRFPLVVKVNRLTRQEDAEL